MPDRTNHDHQTFCIYCQKDYKEPVKLRRHIERMHKDTYAFANVNLDYAKVVQ